MSFLIKLTKCLLDNNSTKYTALAKKDDDFAIEAANAWVTAHPVDYIQREIRYSNIAKIDKYAHELLRSLRQVPITSSNVEILKAHMVEISLRSDLLKQHLIEGIRKFKADKALTIPIIDRISSTFELTT